MYKSADVIIGAAFDIHAAGGRPFACSDEVLGSSVQYAEALEYAIERVNDGRSPIQLNGITLGGLTIDKCQSDIRMADIISNIHFDMLNINDDVGRELDIDSILGWVMNGGPHPQSHQALNTLGLTHVVLEGNGSPDFGMISVSPQYPSDNIVEALAFILAELHIRNINIISSRQDGFVEQIQELSGKRGICVLNTLSFGTGVSPFDVITRLKNSPSHVAVLYLNAAQIAELLQGRQYIAVNTNVLFIIIPNEHVNLTTLSPSLFKNIILLQKDFSYLVDYDTYITKQSLKTPTNAWLVEYYESLYKCKLGKGHAYNVTCKNPAPLISASTYNQDEKIINVVNAVYAMARALQLTLVDICGINYDGLCDRISNPKVLRDEVQERLKLIEFEDDAGRKFQLGRDGTKIQEYNIIGYDSRGESVKVRLVHLYFKAWTYIDDIHCIQVYRQLHECVPQ